MNPRNRILMIAILAATVGSSSAYLAATHRSAQAVAGDLPIHKGATANDGGVVVELCDGVTKMEVPGLKPGQEMTHAQALAVTNQLMDEWKRKHTGQRWTTAQNDTGEKAEGSAEPEEPN